MWGCVEPEIEPSEAEPADFVRQDSELPSSGFGRQESELPSSGFGRQETEFAWPSYIPGVAGSQTQAAIFADSLADSPWHSADYAMPV
jgi:hypothetical protein